MRQVGSNTWCVHHIIEGKLVNESRGLAKQGKRLEIIVSIDLQKDVVRSMNVPGQCHQRLRGQLQRSRVSKRFLAHQV